MTLINGSKFSGGAASLTPIESSGGFTVGGFLWLVGHSREVCKSGLNVAESEAGIVDTNSVVCCFSIL